MTWSKNLALLLCAASCGIGAVEPSALGRSPLSHFGCAGPVPDAPPPQNPWPAARQNLVPAGATSGRICAYTTRLIRDVRVSGEKLQRLVGALQALHRPSHRPSFSSCFFDADPVVIHFTYPGHRLTVAFRTSSCLNASNGDLRRYGGVAENLRLLNLLGRLIHARPPL